jgi:hypothetical protein
MAPPDGARTNRIPALSWDSVVDDPDLAAAAGTSEDIDADLGVADSFTLAPLSLDLSDAADPDESVASPPIESAPIESAPIATPAPAQTPVAAPAPIPTPAAVADPASQPPVAASPPEPDAPIIVRTAPPAVVVPAIGDVTSGPDVIVEPTAARAVGDIDAVDGGLPQIQEATPVDAGVPLLPSVPLPTLRPTSATPFEFDPASVAPVPAAQPRRRRKRRGLKLVIVLLVLGGLVAAGVVFGQAYLFPGEWDDATAPYAEAVEQASGVEFAEPLSIISEPTADFAARLQAQFAAVSTEELAQWRALGLATGTVDDATLAQQLTGWQDAVYSTLDGQVYHDLGVAGAELDAQLVHEMAAASLDQQFGWSVDQPTRMLDAAASVSAEVLRQARAIQQASDFAGPAPSVPSEAVDALPPIIGYRMLAPQVYAEFDGAPVTPEANNPLVDLGEGGPGILGGEPPILAPPPTTSNGDVVIASPVAMDRSFWFLVLAGYLDSRTAFDASEAIVENALTATARGATSCVAATFAGGGVEQTATLRSALTAWSAAAPTAFASSFEVLADGTLQLASCDPGVGFDASTRPGVARELIGWRTAELATFAAIQFGGGGDAELAEAWPFVASTSIALDVAALPPSAPPAEIADFVTQATFDALFGSGG